MGITARVRFDKPDLSALHADNPGHAFVDMHHHTSYSDSYTRIKTLLKKAKQKGIGVAVTDHNVISGSIEAFRSAEEQMVIPGIEVGCQEGPHFLVYFFNLHELAEFYDRYVNPFKGKNPYHNLSIGMEALLEGAKKYNCITAAAHPYAPRYFHLMKRIAQCNINPSVLKDIDAVEVCSTMTFRSMNERALAFAENMEKTFVAGSDGHVAHALGGALTHAKASTVAEFLKKIRHQQQWIVGKEMPTLQRVHPYGQMTTRYARYPSTLPYYYRNHVIDTWKRIKPNVELLASQIAMSGMLAVDFFFKRNL